MSIDYFLRTWKVTKGDSFVKKGQRIEIRRNSEGSDALKFVVPPALPNGKSGFGDGGWPDVNNLQYVGGTVTGTAEVGQGTNTITISEYMPNSKKHIKCTVSSQRFLISLPAVKRRVERFLRRLEGAGEVPEAALPQILKLLYELGNSFEEVGEWEAEDDGG